MLDAYTVRKAIPRIVIAVIGINLSIYICVAAVDITNIIGHGLASLLTGPFANNGEFGRIAIESNTTNNATLGTGVAATAGVLVILKILAGVLGKGVLFKLLGIKFLGILMPFMITIALITLAVLFTIIIRQALLIFLIIISPVAIALFVLPGTEKYFKKWLDLFIKTLMVYPIISVIFAMSTVMATILLGTADLSPDTIGFAKIMGALIVTFAPLVMIPFAFKLAGGAIAAVMNAANGASGNASTRARKGWQTMRQNPNSFVGGLERDARKDLADGRAKIYNRGVESTGLRGSVGRLIGGKRSANIQAAENRESSERVIATSETGNDAYVRAAVLDEDTLYGTSRHRVNQQTGANEYMASTGQWFSEGQVRAARSQFKTAGDMAAAHKLVMSKTENVPPENQQMILDDYVAYANREGLDEGHAAGNWAGVAIPKNAS